MQQRKRFRAAQARRHRERRSESFRHPPCGGGLQTSSLRRRAHSVQHVSSTEKGQANSNTRQMQPEIDEVQFRNSVPAPGLQDMLSGQRDLDSPNQAGLNLSKEGLEMVERLSGPLFEDVKTAIVEGSSPLAYHVRGLLRDSIYPVHIVASDEPSNTTQHPQHTYENSASTIKKKFQRQAKVANMASKVALEQEDKEKVRIVSKEDRIRAKKAAIAEFLEKELKHADTADDDRHWQNDIRWLNGARTNSFAQVLMNVNHIC